jgi:hypothetical protein
MRSQAGRAARRSSKKIATTLALAALAAPLAVAPADASTGSRPVPDVRVMTRNLYLGADIMRPIEAVQGVDPADQLGTLVALANASETTREIVDKTDFNVRGKLLAAEIDRKRPDLVGLQEVALWRHGPLELDKVTVPNATIVDYDFLKILLADLEARGLDYRPVSVNRLSDVESPAFSGPLNAPTSTPRDVRLTMRDVILKRVGSGLTILSHHERKYSHNLSLAIAGHAMNFTRGYQWVDVRRQVNGKRFRFINTHLEAFSSDMAFAQAREMLAGPARYPGPTIIVCDCNSDPLNGTVKPGDTMPHWAPYWLITGKNGFSDTWLQIHQAQQGWTSGLSETVDDPSGAGFDHRIDMVFARTSDGGRLRAHWGWVVGTADSVVGTTPASPDPTTGLWPSDHGGVVMSLRGFR